MRPAGGRPASGRPSQRGKARVTCLGGRKHSKGSERRERDSSRSQNFEVTEPRRERNGWQPDLETVMERTCALFNCYNMADVVFTVGQKEIPAHIIVLGSSSPVFYYRLCDAPATEREGRHRLWRPSIVTEEGHCLPYGTEGDAIASASPGNPLRITVGYDFVSFFEFIRFLYTDDLKITHENVTALTFLADDFKLPSLAERCVQFLEDELGAPHSLKILETLRNYLLKSIVSLWRNIVDRNLMLQDFKEMDLHDRQKRLQVVALSLQTRRSTVRGSSVASSDRGSSRKGPSSRHSASGRSSQRGGGSKAGGSSKWGGSESGAESNNFESTTGNEYGTGLKEDSVVPKGTDIYKLLDVNLSFLGSWQTMHNSIFAVAEELGSKTWEAIRDGTDVALGSPEWLKQTLPFVKLIMSMESTSIKEIDLFRFLNIWAENQCRVRRMALLPEQRRKVVGDDTIQLIRFPVMTVQELMWDVLPTGMLAYEDVHQLQQAITNKSLLGTRFLTEPRGGGMLQIREMKKKEKEVKSKVAERSSSKSSKGSCFGDPDPEPVAAAPQGIEVDGDIDDGSDVNLAVLGAQLWRRRVEDFTEEQQEMLLAFEAGVPVGHPDVRPVLCGNPLQGRSARPASAAPHRQQSLMARSNAASPMVMDTRFLSPEAGSSATPLEPVAKQAGPRRPVTPKDFQRMSPGLYRFRGHRVLEMRLEHGSAAIYEHGEHEPQPPGHGEGPMPARVPLEMLIDDQEP